MKNALSTIVISLLFLMGALMIRHGFASGALRGDDLLEFSFQTYDFGEVPQATVKRAVLNVKNTSNDTVEIVDISTTCRCTNPGASRFSIDRSESVEVPFDFDTGGMRGPTKQLAIVSYKKHDESQSQIFSIEFTANIIPEYDVSPLSWELTENEVQAQNIILKSARKDFVVLSAKSGHPGISADVHQLSPGEFELRVRFDPEIAPNFDGDHSLQVMTSSVVQPLFVFAISTKKDTTRGVNDD